MTHTNGLTKITPEDGVNATHEYLKWFLTQFDESKRGSIHDFMELSLAKMIQLSIDNIDTYLGTGHKKVSATEITYIVLDSYQKVIDNMRRNLDGMKEVGFE